jgi:hypothetical protein
MAVVIRFVDRNGFTRERFLDIVHVLDTSSATLKHELSAVLVNHQLDVSKLRGQGMMVLVTCVGSGMDYKPSQLF